MSSDNPTTGAHRAGFVCLAGPTNAGKSTLMNAIIGHKVAIITPKPQTTRNRLLGIHNVAGGAGQIIFVDTPGWHRPQGKLGERMMEVASRSLEDTDVALLVVDVSRDRPAAGRISGGNAAAVRRVMEASVPVVVALNQVDKIANKDLLLPLMAAYTEATGEAEVVPISALKRDGLDRLERLMLGYLPESPPLYPTDLLSDQAERFIAAEIIREKVILQTHDELPYSTAVEVEQWKETPGEPTPLSIAAVIHVERDSQKGIVIGKGGSRIKQIGMAAREELEQVFGAKVFLELFVHVEKDWTKDGRRLNRLGY